MPLPFRKMCLAFGSRSPETMKIALNGRLSI